MDYIDIKRESNDIKILIKVIFSEKYFINLVHVFGPAFLHYSTWNWVQVRYSGAKKCAV